MEIFPQVLIIILVAAALLCGWVLVPKITKGLKFAQNYVRKLLAEERVTNGHDTYHAWRHDTSKLGF